MADKSLVRPYSEQVLRALENRYGPLPEGVPSVAYIFEPGIEGRCLYISPSVEEVLGYPRRQWLEERGLWDRLLHADDADRVVSNEAECARSGEKLVQEYRLRAADGRDVWIRDEMTVVSDRQTSRPSAALRRYSWTSFSPERAHSASFETTRSASSACSRRSQSPRSSSHWRRG